MLGIIRTTSPRRRRLTRRGIVAVLTAFCLCALFAFVALSVDSSRIVLTETRMQNTADAAALAAAQEIISAVEAAANGQGTAVSDGNAIAVAAARQIAAQVAAANGMYLNPESDVRFGRRTFSGQSGNWPIEWGVGPFNTVQVVVRKTNPDVTAADGQFPLAFGWAVNRSQVSLQAAATAFIEARDLVVVLDYSASMNDDSSLNAIGNFSQADVEAALDGMWNALVAAAPTWPGTQELKFRPLGEINSPAGVYLSSSDTNTIFNALRLGETFSNGTPKFPFPQAGRQSNGLPKSRPSASASATLWKNYINYVKGRSGPYKKRYGYRTLMDYFQEQRYDRDLAEDLWRTPHYPFHAIKEGTTLFFDYLTDVDFGDEVGLVSYGAYAVKEWTHSDGEVSIDIRSNPITNDYAALDEIQRRHQAGDYDGWTGMGDGILKAHELLLGNPGNPADTGFVRYGARPTMVVMTDGQTNQGPSGWTLPAGFSWAKWTDYDGDGVANYTTTDWKKQYAFWEATRAIERGITLHAMAVGATADRDLMRAIAFAGGGIYIDVPGGSRIADMESQMSEAFRQIAAKVPPAKLVNAEVGP
jgi:Flp pilus assembly protein TadG